MDTGNKKETTIEKKFLMEIPSLCGETEEFLPVFYIRFRFSFKLNRITVYLHCYTCKKKIR
jgi:hypothetical protein